VCEQHGHEALLALDDTSREAAVLGLGGIIYLELIR
jgi:hypothetical protein